MTDQDKSQFPDIRLLNLLDDAIQTNIKADPQIKQHAKILRSIPGIGPVLCTALSTEMPDLG